MLFRTYETVRPEEAPVHLIAQQLRLPLGGCLPFGEQPTCTACGSRCGSGAVVEGRWRCADCLYLDGRLESAERGARRPFGRGKARSW